MALITVGIASVTDAGVTSPGETVTAHARERTISKRMVRTPAEIAHHRRMTGAAEVSVLVDQKMLAGAMDAVAGRAGEILSDMRIKPDDRQLGVRAMTAGTRLLCLSRRHSGRIPYVVDSGVLDVVCRAGVTTDAGDAH